LQTTIASAERKQLADWLDRKHKEVEAHLKKLGITGQPKAGTSEGRTASAETLQVLGRRFNSDSKVRAPHVHPLEYREDEDW
jgi:hypothetical protein